MRKFVVRNLRTSIENLNKRIDELEAGDLDILKELLSALEFLLEEVGDPTPAIDKYNEIISFLDLMENTSKLKSLLDDIRNSIPTKLSDLEKDVDVAVNTNGHDYVEIAGIKWATMNIGASNVTDGGLYFLWGDTQGYTADLVGAEPKKPFNWKDYKYNSGVSKNITKYNDTDNKKTLDFSDDAARVNWGGDWRVPTQGEWEALALATNISWDDNYNNSGVSGYVLTDKTDLNKKLFFLATGFCNNGDITIDHYANDSTDDHFAMFWGNSIYSHTPTQDYDGYENAKVYHFTWGVQNQGFIKGPVSQPRCQGLAIRAVLNELSTLNKVATTGDYNDLNNKPTIPAALIQSDWNQSDTTANDYIKNKPVISNTNDFLIKPTAQLSAEGHDYVEIGGIKWATMNVGASTVTDAGLYFLWADTQGYTANQIGTDKQFSESDCKYGPVDENDGPDYGMTKYNDTDGLTTIQSSDDAVKVAWGGNWRMPTGDEFEALGAAVNTEWVSNYLSSGISGMLLTDKTNSNRKLFFPASGCGTEGSIYNAGTDGWYWSSTLYGAECYVAHGPHFDLTGIDDWIAPGARYIGCNIRGVYDGTVQSTQAAIVATTGDYNDLSNKPNLSTVATTGSYNDLINKPEIIRVVEITGNLSNLTTSVSGIENDGKKETVIYINNTENTYYVTVSNSYKTLRNTQLSLVACPGGYCEVSYTNKGGIIFAKGLIIGVRLVDPNSKYVLATYDVTNTSNATTLITRSSLAYADMEIDGVLQPSPVNSYTFDTTGEHTVKFILPDQDFNEQSGIMFGDLSYSGSSRLKSIVLPEGITTIPNSAFFACPRLESVTLPSTIRTIGNAAFGSYIQSSSGSSTLIGCDRLSSINIPNGVTSIGYNCFVGCTSLTSITIPDSVTSLGYSSFSKCTGLTTVSLGTGLTTLQQEMFRGCTSLTDVTISNTITSILEGVFCGCSSLQTIVIPDSVTDFGGTYPYLHTLEGVFAGCTSLTNVTLSNNIGSLKGHDFYNCTSLQTLNIPDKLQYFDSTAFKGCSSLTAFNVSNNNAKLSSIDGVIYNKDATRLIKYPTAKQGTFVVPSTVTRLDDGDRHKNPFAYCNGVTTVEIGQNVSIIYPYNFSGCSSLTTVTVDPNNQTYSSIDGILYNKNATKLIRCPEGKQSVTIPNTVTELGENAFINCANITNVNIPNSVTTIGGSSFNGCTNLSNITIPSSVTSIEDCSNFDNCTSLPVINGIRYADTFAIKAVEERNEYTIQSGTRFIGEAAFEYQENLQSITIPSTVVAMGDYVFDDCDKLTTITFEGTTAPSVLPDTFRGVKSSGGTIRVPANSTGYDVIMQKNGLSNWTKVEY